MDCEGTGEVPLASTGATSRNWERWPITVSRPDGDLRAGRERFGEHELRRSAWSSRPSDKARHPASGKS